MKRILTITLAALCGLSASAQMTQENQFDEFEKNVYVSENGDSLLYRLLRPEAMKKSGKYPLVIFLHGAGERGNDNRKQLAKGGQMWLNPVNREKYPSFVLLPQCPENSRWTTISRYSRKDKGEEAPSVMPQLKALIDTFLKMDEIDKDRVYITGLSMGGVGTFDMCVTYPEIFAAALPICGETRPELLKKARKIKFRIYHGDKDFVVPFENSRNAYKELKRLGADVTYIEKVEVGHGVWNEAFNDPEYLGWMFRQRRKR